MRRGDDADMDILWVTLGSALGGLGRYWLSGMVEALLGESFPFGTLTVNVLGCLVIGFFAGIAGGDATGAEGGRLLGPWAQQFVMVGVCGGFTTFSAFGLQTFNLARGEEWFRAGANIMLSLVLCLLAIWLGHMVASALHRPTGS
jgi:CrcB protein